MKTEIYKSCLVAAATSLLVSGCVVHETRYRDRPVEVREREVIVQSEPPAPIVETVVESPGPDYVWVGGNWTWHDRWVWEGGHWARPPHHGAVWVPHHYVYRNGHHVYIHGGWR